MELKSHLETALNLAVLAVSLVVIGVFVSEYTSQNPNKPSDNSLKKGSVLPASVRLDFTRHQRTLVLLLSTHCKYCVDSLPFYRQLEQLGGRGDSSKISVVVVFPDDDREVTEFVKANGLGFNTVSRVNYSDLRVSKTPSILLVDSRGRILDAWVGKLTAGSEREVIRTVSL